MIKLLFICFMMLQLGCSKKEQTPLTRSSWPSLEQSFDLPEQIELGESIVFLWPTETYFKTHKSKSYSSFSNYMAFFTTDLFSIQNNIEDDKKIFFKGLKKLKQICKNGCDDFDDKKDDLIFSYFDKLSPNLEKLHFLFEKSLSDHENLILTHTFEPSIEPVSISFKNKSINLPIFKNQSLGIEKLNSSHITSWELKTSPYNRLLIEFLIEGLEVKLDLSLSKKDLIKGTGDITIYKNNIEIRKGIASFEEVLL